MLLKHVQYFLAVSEYKHFTLAANKLFITQSALSQQISKLEDSLGVKLIRRDKHPIELTEAGEAFLGYAQKIGADIQDMTTGMAKFTTKEKYTISLGTIVGLGQIDLTKVLNTCLTKYPTLKFSMINALSKDLCAMLDNDEIDFALVAAGDHMRSYNFESIILQDDEFVLIVPERHLLARKKLVPLSATAEENYIFSDTKNVSRDIFFAQCLKAGFEPKIISECNNPGRRVELVKSGLGIALISTSSLSNFNCTGIAVLHLQEPFYKTMVLVRKKALPLTGPRKIFWQCFNQHLPQKVR